ncbi:MAG: response regulator [Bacteroidota bacterium]
MEKHILLIDDDPDEIDIFLDALRSKGMDVKCSTVNSAEEAMKFLQRIMPDYIVLDYKMPKTDGIECLANIKALPHLSHIPVIMYSSTMNDEDIKTAMIVGAAGHIKKPFDMRTLALLLQPFL